MAARLRLATTWLGGCSGCHMSFLDMDEWLIDLAQVADIVYTPVADFKVFPENVDVTLVEGAVANEDNLEQAHIVRRNSKIVISFGDCAVTGNATALRNGWHTAEPVLKRSYIELATVRPELPSDPGVLPRLLDTVRPVHQVIPVEFFMPGCPPPANRIREVLEGFVAGKTPHLEGREIKFG